MIITNSRRINYVNPSTIGGFGTTPTFFVDFTIPNEYAGNIKQIAIKFQWSLTKNNTGFPAGGYYIVRDPLFSFNFLTPDKVFGVKYIAPKTSTNYTNFITTLQNWPIYNPDLNGAATPSQAYYNETYIIEELEDQNNPNYEVTFDEFCGKQSCLSVGYIANPALFLTNIPGLNFTDIELAFSCQIAITVDNPRIF